MADFDGDDDKDVVVCSDGEGAHKGGCGWLPRQAWAAPRKMEDLKIIICSPGNGAMLTYLPQLTICISPYASPAFKLSSAFGMSFTMVCLTRLESFWGESCEFQVYQVDIFLFPSTASREQNL